MENSRFLRRALSDVKGVELPRVPDGCTPVYNQFPILLRDEHIRASVHRAILKTGLARERGVLIAGNAADWDRRTDNIGSGNAKVRRTVSYLRQK